MLASRGSLYRNCEDEAEEQISFPSYDMAGFFDQTEDLKSSASLRTSDSCTVMPSPKSISETIVFTKPARIAKDDMAVRNEPSRHVDYLSHDWKEEDIWSTWRYIVSKGKLHSNSKRLENASWRAWMKAKYRLRTISPDTLGWRKDSDVTWLYGPHQTKPGYIRVTSSSSPGSQISKPACFVARRPILKQRSASETLLQQSLNAGPSPKQTAAVVHTPSGNATCIVTPSSFSISVSKCYSGLLPCATPSGVQSLGFRDKRQIRFNDKVEQRIAVDLMHVNEVNEGNEDNEDSCVIYDDDNDAFGEGVTIMQSSLSSVADRELGRRSSFSIASKTIATLPSTTLKNYEHTRRLEGPVSNQAMKSCKAGNSSPSPSREILQLPAKFLLDVDDYDDDGMDMGWQAPRIVSYKDDSDVIELNQLQGYSFDPHGDCPGPMFPRPPYGTSIHYEEDEEALLLQLGCIQAS